MLFLYISRVSISTQLKTMHYLLKLCEILKIISSNCLFDGITIYFISNYIFREFDILKFLSALIENIKACFFNIRIIIHIDKESLF